MQATPTLDIARKSNVAVASNTQNQHPGITDAACAFALSLIQEHGFDPSTKAQAAAHEAGHLTVALALGGEFKRGRLHRNPDDTWGGYQECFVPGLHLTDGQLFVVADEPLRAFWLTVIYAAGFAGEAVAGLVHPSSSPDERVMVEGIAAQVGFNPKLPYLTAWRTLTRNQLVFDTLRSTLHRNRRLFAADVERLLPKLTKVDMQASNPIHITKNQGGSK